MNHPRLPCSASTWSQRRERSLYALPLAIRLAQTCLACLIALLPLLTSPAGDAAAQTVEPVHDLPGLALDRDGASRATRRQASLDLAASASAAQSSDPVPLFQLTRPNGITFDRASPPNLWITSDATFNALLSKFPETGPRQDFPYGNFGSSEAIGQLATEPNANFIWMLTQYGDVLALDAANPTEWRLLASIKSMPVDTNTMYDVATGRVHNGNGVVNTQVASYGDIALLQRANYFDAFLTGESLSHPFVLRLRWSMPSGAFHSAKVVAYSSQSTSLRNTRGIAVKQDGTVVTVLSLIVSGPPAVDRALFFHADFPEGGGISPVFFDPQLGNFTTAGMTTDGAGRIYAPAHTETCGPVPTAALLVFTPNLLGGACYPLPEAASSIRDVAVSDDGELVFITSNVTGNVYRYILPPAPSDTTAPIAPALTIGEAAGDDPDQHVAGTTLYYNPSGSRSGSVQVTAVTDDPESGIAAVAFPTVFGGDGGSDTTRPYTMTYAWAAGATASGVKTVTATNGAGLTGDSTFTVTPDTIPPVPSFTAPNPGATVGNGTAVSVSANDTLSGVAGVEFRFCPGTSCGFGSGISLGADATAPYAVTWTNQPADGLYTIVARATDHVGNVSDATRSVTVRNAPVDTSPPAVPQLILQESEPDEHVAGSTLFYNPAAGQSGAFTVSATSADPESGIAAIAFPVVFGGDGGSDTLIPFETTYVWSAGAAASGAQSVIATNGAGLTNAASFIVTPDTAAPTVTLSAPAAGATIGNGAPLSASASDALSGVARVEFRYCGGTSCSFAAGTTIDIDQSAPYAATWVGQPTDGSYTIIARTTDNVGNVTEAAPRTVIIRNTAADTTPPTAPELTLVEDESDQHVIGTQLIYNPASGNSGTFTVRAQTTDDESGVAAVIFPAIFGNDGGSDTSLPFAQGYAWTAGATASGVRTVTTRNGEGLTAAADFTVTPDTAAPSIAIASPSAGAVITEGMPLNLNASDALAGVARVEVRFCPGATCQFGDGSAIGADTTAPFAITWNGLPAAGPYTLIARATDQVGNSRDSTPVSVRVGNRGPTGVSAGGPYVVNEGGSVAVTGTATDPDGDPLGFGWDLDANGVLDTGGKSATFSAAGLDGPANRQIGFAACDNLNACAVAVGAVSVVNVAPTISGVTNSGPVAVGSRASITVTATDPAGTGDPLAYEFDCDGNGQFEIGPQVASSAECAFAAAGNRPVTVRVNDGDGGVATRTTNVAVTSARLPATCRPQESQSAALSNAACDGRLDTVWVSKKDKKKGETVSVTFDLGAPGTDGPHAVAEIRWQFSSGCCDKVTIQTSANGTTFQSLATLSGRPGANIWQLQPGPLQPVEQIRFVFTGKKSGQVGFVRDVEFCATACASGAGAAARAAIAADVPTDQPAAGAATTSDTPPAPEATAETAPRDAPRLHLSHPEPGATLSGTHPVAATPAGNEGRVSEIVFEIRSDGGAWATLGTVENPPYEREIAFASFPPGEYDLRAVTLAREGVRLTSEPVPVTIAAAERPGEDDPAAADQSAAGNERDPAAEPAAPAVATAGPPSAAEDPTPPTAEANPEAATEARERAPDDPGRVTGNTHHPEHRGEGRAKRQHADDTHKQKQKQKQKQKRGDGGKSAGKHHQSPGKDRHAR